MKRILDRKLRDLESKSTGRVSLASYRKLRATKSYYLSGFESEEGRRSEEAEETCVTAFLRMFKFADVHDNDSGWTPLRCAALCGNEVIVRELIALGVDVNAPFPRNLADTWITVNAMKGMNIICQAAIWCYTPERMRILDLLYFDGKAKLVQNNLDVLIIALYRRTLKGQRNYGADWVLDTFPEWDVNAVAYGLPSYSFATLAMSNNLPLVRRLIERHGAKLSTTFTPCKIDLLHSACHNAFDVEIAEYVYDKMIHVHPSSWTVSSKSTMSASTYYGVRLLWWMTGKPRFVGRRLRAFYRSTLLHDAVQEGNLSCVKWLLEIGADPRIKNREGENPLTIAQKLGYNGIGKLLASTDRCDEVIEKKPRNDVPYKSLASRARDACARFPYGTQECRETE